MNADTEEFLEHYGVKGMSWGKRKQLREASRTPKQRHMHKLKVSVAKAAAKGAVVWLALGVANNAIGRKLSTGKFFVKEDLSVTKTFGLAAQSQTAVNGARIAKQIFERNVAQ